MHLRVVRLLASMLLVLSAVPSHATLYEIDTRSDGINSDGDCSIREALLAINTQAAVDSCRAGTGTDRIVLKVGVTYELTEGQALQIGGDVTDVTNEDGDVVGTEDVNPSVRIELEDDDEEGDGNAIIDALGLDRVFYVNGDANLTIRGISLRNGATTADGGLVYVEPDASFKARGKSTLSSGSAVNGGLVYVEGGTLDIAEESRLENGQASGHGGAVYAEGDSILALDAVAVVGNDSGGDGGAFYTAADFDGLFSIFDSYVGENSASGEGGALYVQSDRLSFDSANSSYISNTSAAGAGAIHLAAPTTDINTLFNNVTVANNTSDSSSGSVFIGAGDEQDRIINSVIAGDLGGMPGMSECAPGSVLADGDNDTVLLAFNILGSGCDAGDGSNEIMANSITALANDQGNCGNAANTASPGCDPAPLEPFPGYLPDPSASPTAFSLANNGVSPNNLCRSEDQRGVSRLEDRCDAGSVEFSTAVGVRDEIEVVWGRNEVLDVVDNDLGDTTIDCTRPAVSSNPLTPELPATLSGDPLIDDCIQLVLVPGVTTASVVFQVDGSGYPTAVYRPGQTFHGVDSFAYKVNRHAFEVTRQDDDVEAETNVISEPASGLTSSEEIDQTAGGAGLLTVFLALLLGLQRKRRWVAALFAALMVHQPLNAAEITVTSLLDNRDYGDGFCTLREAIQSSQDNSVAREPACVSGQDGRDTIILPRGCITLDPVLGSLQVSNQLTIRGEGPHGVDAAAGLDGSECSPNDDSNPDWTEGSIIRASATPFTAGFRIFDATAALRVERLSLMYGDSPLDGGAIRTGNLLEVEQVEFYQNRAEGSPGTADGGAIYLVGDQDPTSDQTVFIRDSYFLANEANGSGGALAMTPTRYDIDVEGVTFHQNSAAGTGGAINMAVSRGTIWFVNTTILSNTADAGTGGIDLTQVVRDTANTDSNAIPAVNIVNSTIVSNQGTTTGGIDLGPDDDGNGQDFERNIRMGNTVLGDNQDLGGSQSNACSSAGSPEPFEYVVHSLLSGSAVQCPVRPTSGESTGTVYGEPGADINASFLFPVAQNTAPGEEVFVAPNLAVDPGGPSAAEIIDSGNDESLSSGTTGSPKRCRDLDVRGFPRTSGDACDRGAYEFQETTAQDDLADNDNQGGSQLFIDVLDNDSTDPVQGYEIDDASINPMNINVLPSGDTPGIAIVYGVFNDIACGDPVTADDVDDLTRRKFNQLLDELDIDEEDLDKDNVDVSSLSCGVLYDPLHVDPLDENSAENDIDCADLPLEFEEGNPAFQYEFQAVDTVAPISAPQTSTTADVLLTFDNVPPVIEPVSILNQPGETVVIRLDIKDEFGGAIDYSSLEVADEPEFAKEDLNGDFLGEGIKLNHPSNGFITYVPGDITKTFRERFSVRISDDCPEPKRSNSANITINYPQEDAAGGELLSGGAWFQALLVLLFSGMVRRSTGR
jgi:CSLREA domain-containing protein